MENYRFKALKERAFEIESELKEQGLMGPDIEIIGAVLFSKYMGEDKRFKEMFENTAELIKKAEELLARFNKEEEL
jgi:hypothetical protein